MSWRRRLLRGVWRAAAGGPDSLAPSAVVLTWDGVTTDTTPNFSVDLPSGNGPPLDAAENDVLRLESDINILYATRTLNGVDIIDDIINQSGVTPLAAGSYPNFRVRLERGIHYGPWRTVINGPVVVAASDDNDYAAWMAAAA